MDVDLRRGESFFRLGATRRRRKDHSTHLHAETSGLNDPKWNTSRRQVDRGIALLHALRKKTSLDIACAIVRCHIYSAPINYIFANSRSTLESLPRVA